MLMHSYDSAWILRRIPWNIYETTLSNSPTPENIVIPEQERFDSQTELRQDVQDCWNYIP